MIIPRVQKKKFRVDMAPLIDVVFLLLIFFMLTFAIQGKGMDLSLPQAGSGAGTPDRLPVIKIQKEGPIFLDGRPMNFDSLKAAIQARMKNADQKTVVIEAESEARYELFVRIMDISRKAGVEDFSIISEKFQ